MCSHVESLAFAQRFFSDSVVTEKGFFAEAQAGDRSRTANDISRGAIEV